MHAKGHLFAIYGSAYKCWNHTVCLLRVESEFGDTLPFFTIYVKHYLICWCAGSEGECVCASSGCSRPVTQCGADCVGRCCFMCQAHFYRRLVLYTSHIKLVVQSCLKKVRRGACGVISLCFSPIIEPLSFPAKTNTKGYISVVIKNVVWKSKDALNEYHSTRGQSYVWERCVRVCACFCAGPESACKGVNLRWRKAVSQTATLAVALGEQEG